MKTDTYVEKEKGLIMAGKREKTREMIIDFSYALFAMKGFKQVTMKDICEVTGMSRGGLYSHFSGTDKLFEAVLERTMGNSAMDFHTEIEKGASAIEILDRALKLMEDEMKHPEDSLSVAIYEYAEMVDSDLIEKLNQNAEKKWKNLITYGMKRGEFCNINVDEIVNVILYSYQGARLWSSIIPMKPKAFHSIANHIKRQLKGEDYDNT